MSAALGAANSRRPSTGFVGRVVFPNNWGGVLGRVEEKNLSPTTRPHTYAERETGTVRDCARADGPTTTRRVLGDVVDVNEPHTPRLLIGRLVAFRPAPRETTSYVTRVTLPRRRRV